MAKSVPDSYFTKNPTDSLPNDWVRPDKHNWLTAAKLFYEYGLSKAEAMYWGGFKATHAKSNPMAFDKSPIVQEYMATKGLDKDSVAKKAIATLGAINTTLRKLISVKGQKEGFIEIIKEIRENFKAMYQFAGGAFVTRHKHGGDDEGKSIKGDFTVSWSDGNTDSDSK